jgi:transcription initiation factor IIE alpha subunit
MTKPKKTKPKAKASQKPKGNNNAKKRFLPKSRPIVKKTQKPQPKQKQASRQLPQKGTTLKANQQHDLQSATKKKEAAKEVAGRKKVNVNIPQPEDVKIALDRLLNNQRATEYLTKNVSKMAVDVIGMLVTPKTDEFLAEQLAMKINAIRRILNIMQGYGITNYYISKNTKGWLSFAWYINTNKLGPFLDYIEGMEKEKSIVNEGCNDYFVCESCYKTDRFIFTFDSAFESNFKCNNCNRNLSRMNKEEVTLLMASKSA